MRTGVVVLAVVSLTLLALSTPVSAARSGSEVDADTEAIVSAEVDQLLQQEEQQEQQQQQLAASTIVLTGPKGGGGGGGGKAKAAAAPRASAKVSASVRVSKPKPSARAGGKAVSKRAGGGAKKKAGGLKKKIKKLFKKLKNKLKGKKKGKKKGGKKLKKSKKNKKNKKKKGKKGKKVKKNKKKKGKKGKKKKGKKNKKNKKKKKKSKKNKKKKKKSKKNKKKKKKSKKNKKKKNKKKKMKKKLKKLLKKLRKLLKKKRAAAKRRREQRRKERLRKHKEAKALAAYQKKDIAAAEALEKKFDREDKKWREGRAEQYRAWAHKKKMDKLKFEEDIRAARGLMLDEKSKDGKDAYAAAVERNNAITRAAWERNMQRKRDRDAREAADMATNPKRGVFRRYVNRHRIRAAEAAWAEATEGPLAPPYKKVKPKKYRKYAFPKKYEGKF